MSDSDKEHYLGWLDTLDGYHAALALDVAGCGASRSGSTVQQATQQALEACKEDCSYDWSCKVMDVDGASTFIKQKGAGTSEAANDGGVRKRNRGEG